MKALCPVCQRLQIKTPMQRGAEHLSTISTRHCARTHARTQVGVECELRQRCLAMYCIGIKKGKTMVEREGKKIRIIVKGIFHLKKNIRTLYPQKTKKERVNE